MEGLSQLRNSFRNQPEENILRDQFANDELDLTGIDLISAPEYPTFTGQVVQDFYNAYAENPGDEFSLAKIIYENIRINRNLAANNRYWVYMNLTSFYRYIKDRWTNRTDDDIEVPEDREIDRFFLSLESSQNKLIKSPVAGLWWAIELTIDDTRDDDVYYYSKIFLSDRNLRDKNLGGYKMIRDKKVLFALLDFYQENRNAESDGERIGSEAIAQQMSKLLNQIGGLRLLRYMTQDEIKQILDDNKALILSRAVETKKAKTTSRQRLQLARRGVIEMDGQVNIPYFFNLDPESGEYKISDMPDDTYYYNVGIDTNNPNCYLIQVYNEGKIKKTNLSELRSKIEKGRLNRIYQNGVCMNLSPNNVESIFGEVLFGLCYSDGNQTYLKLMNAQDNDNFRNDNSSLNQEGKKVIYTDVIQSLKFTTIPFEHRDSLSRFVMGAGAKGVVFLNPTYNREWTILEEVWPELFEMEI